MALRAVLFVDMTDSVGRAERVGSERAAEEFVRLHDVLRTLAGQHSGRVVKTLGDGALLDLPHATGALAVALAVVHGPEADLPLRATFCVGEVVERENDVFGDPVHVAARLLGIAKRGQILTTLASAEQVGPDPPLRTRHLGVRQLRGFSRRVQVVEVLPDDLEMLTRQATFLMSEFPGEQRVLRLSFADTALQCGGESTFEPVTVGRAPDSMIMIDSERVSRNHLTIHRRNGCFYLRDHSSNGTLIEADEGAPVPLRNEETLLIGSGRIVPGTTQSDSDQPHIHFAMVAGPTVPASPPHSTEERP